MAERKLSSNSKLLKRDRPYCLKCSSQYAKNFYKSVNKDHSSGYLPYCKECIGRKFYDYYEVHNGDIEIALYLTCRVLGVPYKELAIPKAMERVENEQRSKEDYPVANVYMFYFQYLNNYFKTVEDIDMSFDDSDICMKAVATSAHQAKDLQETMEKLKSPEETARRKELEELRLQFGNYADDEDLYWLRDRYKEWEKGKPLTTVALRNGVAIICQLELSIQKKLGAGKDAKKELDSLKSQLDITGLQPKTDKNPNEKKRTIGMKIEDLEVTKPADSIKLRNKYRDVDKIEKMFEVHFRAPLKRSLGREDSDTAAMEKEVQEKYKISAKELKELGGVDTETEGIEDE